MTKADKGDEDMMFIVGQSLLDGTNGFPQDTELGLKYLEESVEQDNDEAAELYSQLLFVGKIIEKDVEKATKMIEKAVLNGSLSAKLVRAKIEISKEKADYQIIEKLLNEAKDSGNAESMILLRNLEMKENEEKGLKRNFSDSLKYFKMAADKSDGEGMAYYSHFLRYGFGVIDFDHKESARYAKMPADQKNMKGAALYADFLSQGIGTQKNENLAVYYAKLSCDNNDSFGLNVHGSFLERGVGHTEQNIPESVEYFKRSAEEGSIEGLCNYGQTFYYGEKYNQQSDLKKASEYFKKSFEEGCPFAGRMYGSVLLSELGSEKNISEGIKYIKYSADIGNPESMYIYVTHLIKGQYININKDEGFRYLKMEAERQNKNCIKLYMEQTDNFHSFNLDDPKDQFFYGINYFLGNGVS